MNLSIYKKSHIFTLFLSLLVCLSEVAFAQQSKGTVKGYIYTADNKPADNVSITLKGTQLGTITNQNGYFALRAPQGTYQLMMSHVGVQARTFDIEIVAGKVTTLPATTISASTGELKEISVNGSKVNKFKFKRSESVSKMPLDNLENAQSYSTIAKDLIQDQGLISADDALKDAPGVQRMWQATGRSGDGGSYYALRGFIVQSQLRNGVAGNISNTIDPVNLERIEVIKGPSATLFGSSLTSYGGLINRVTKRPYDDFGGEVSYSAGNYGLQRSTLDLNTPLDSAKKLLFRLNTAYTYQGSFQQYDYNKNYVLDPSFTYKVNDKLAFNIDAEMSFGRGDINTIFFFPYGVNVSQLGATRADQLNIDYRNSYHDPDLTERSRNINLFGQIDYKFSGHWRSQTNVSAVNSYSNGFGPYIYLEPNNTMSREDQSTINSKEAELDIQENINGDFKIGSMRNRVVFGLDYLHINSNQMFYYGAFDIAPDQSATFNYDNFNKAALNAGRANGSLAAYNYPYIFKNNNYSAYVSDVLNITDRLIASAGVRVDNFHNETVYHQTDLSPKFGLVYQLVKDQVSVFGNYQNGFTNENGKDFSGKSFDPEQANQIEGGVKLDLFNGKLSGTLSYYDIDVKHVLRTDIAHPQFQIQNGSQVSKGFEAEVIANPVQGFNLVAGFSYNDSKYKNADADVEGRRPATAMSPTTANLWASYRFLYGSLKGFGLGFGGNYASDNKVVNSVSQGVFILPSYTILNSGVSYDHGNYRIGLNVNNLANKEWYIGYSSINPQMLRQYIASFTFRF